MLSSRAPRHSCCWRNGDCARPDRGRTPGPAEAGWSTPPMSSKPAHTIQGTHHHFGWDHAIPPVLTIAPGETVEFEVVDAGGGQLSSTSTVADVGRIDFARVNPVTGPVFVDGARPGDALKVTIREF